MNLITLCNLLNKNDTQIRELCTNKGIEITCDKEGEYINNHDAQQLLENQITNPTRYNKYGMECVELQSILCGNNNVQYSYLCNIIKYLYRRGNVGDLKKAKQYMEMWIKDVEDGRDIIK